MAFTKYTGNLTGQAGSLITALDAALVSGQGWTTPYTGTNKKVYRPAAGNRFYYRVNDNGAGSGGLKEALIKGAESMSDVDTPINPFPSAAQCATTENSLVLRKSNSADATNRPYIIYADSKMFLMMVQTADASYTGFFYAGDFCSVVLNDSYRSCIAGSYAEASVASNHFYDGHQYSSPTSTLSYGLFAARCHLGTGGSIGLTRYNNYSLQSSNGFKGLVKCPNPVDGGLYFSRLWVTEYTGGNIVWRGYLRGLWAWCHDSFPYANGDTISGTGALNGKSFQVVNPLFGPGGIPTMLVETSDTLD